MPFRLTTSMHILQLDLDDKRQVDDFLRLPFSIYRDIPQRVPPLQTDERSDSTQKGRVPLAASPCWIIVATTSFSNGAGLPPKYRGSGGTTILYSEMFKFVAENPRYRHAEVVQIGVENKNMQREMENFGIDFYKIHRTYSRELT